MATRYKHILGDYELRQARQSGDIIEVRIKDKGAYDPDAMQDGVRSLVTQVSQDVLLDQLNQAVRFYKRNGTDVKLFAIARTP